MSALYPNKRRRRTATSVFAGDFDPHPQRDVLTSLLNGVPIYKEVERDEEVRRARREKERERKERAKEREKDKRRASTSSKPQKDKQPAIAGPSVSAVTVPPTNPKKNIAAPRPVVSAAPFWQARPAIHIPNIQRSVSVTPPPMVSSPPSTPAPSMSSATSAVSSKRPHTPHDDESVTGRGRSQDSSTPPPQPPLQKKRRIACRKGWKGWVEGSPPPSEKLINLDVVAVLGERRTRSGKSFDAIGVGKDSWV